MQTYQVAALQNEPLDALVWRVTGATAGIFEQVLALNEGIADLGPLLPEGYRVTLPVVSAKPATEHKIVQLWE